MGSQESICGQLSHPDMTKLISLRAIRAGSTEDREVAGSSAGTLEMMESGRETWNAEWRWGKLRRSKSSAQFWSCLADSCTCQLGTPSKHTLRRHAFVRAEREACSVKAMRKITYREIVEG